MPTRIKICGITREQDAEAVVSAGADALGLMFVASSPRAVSVERARAIAAAVAGRVTRVGVFMDPDPDEVQRVLQSVELDVLQFHGSERGEDCQRFGLPFMKAVRVREPLDVAALEAEYDAACCLLLDAWVAGQPGGTGTRFDWSLWPARSSLPLVLAGGLDVGNVGNAVRRLEPWGVDVSGGVESAVKGRKDPEKIRRFVNEVKRARSE